MSMVSKMLEKTSGLRLRSVSEIETMRTKQPATSVTAVGKMAQLCQWCQEVKTRVDGVQDVSLNLALLSPNPWRTQKYPLAAEQVPFTLGKKEGDVRPSIVVRPSPSKLGHYEIIVGDLWFFAAKKAGLDGIRARIVELSDEEMAIWVLRESQLRQMRMRDVLEEVAPQI